VDISLLGRFGCGDRLAVGVGKLVNPTMNLRKLKKFQFDYNRWKK
tara:strand:+ start:549 stop:683 length:135 start_codon:yes stop_codon:yes gene_type:complete